jgi:hypothetical protein
VTFVTLVSFIIKEYGPVMGQGLAKIISLAWLDRVEQSTRREKMDR